MKNRGEQIAEVWAQIPDDVDVLITHGPPYGHGDLCPPYRTPQRKVAGCLFNDTPTTEIYTKDRRHPRAHVFGHIHDGFGATQGDEFGLLVFINASTCTEKYHPTNRPVTFEVG